MILFAHITPGGDMAAAVEAKVELWIEAEQIAGQVCLLEQRLRKLGESTEGMPPKINMWLASLTDVHTGLSQYAERGKRVSHR